MAFEYLYLKVLKISIRINKLLKPKIFKYKKWEGFFKLNLKISK